MLKKDEIWIGVLWGIMVPFVTYAIILTFYDFADAQGWFENTDSSTDFRSRTQALVSIAANLMTINFFRRKRFDNCMRGVVIATAAYIILWTIVYGKSFIA